MGIFSFMLKIIRHLFPLFLVQFFTWLALFSLWIYATPVITKYIFKTTDAESNAFESGTTWVGICFAFYSTLAALLAFAIPHLSKRISKYRLHALALLIGSIGLLLIYLIKNQYLLLISFAFIGIGWSSISNIPYSIISDIAPENKMSTYFAVFNFSIVIPQITAAFLLGFITRHYFGGETIYAILTGGLSMFVAAVIMFLIKEKAAEKIQQL
jgi:maltose/moltooligosaccharide transporter